MKLLKQCTLDGVTRENEIWKDIPNYEGLYQVSNSGSVKSLAFNKERILSSAADGGGYLNVRLYKDKLSKTKKVHQLVAMAFLKHEPCGMKMVVNHINHNRLDNNVNNLEVISNRENTSQSHLKSSSKYTGVTYHSQRGKWMARIWINKNRVYLGLFDCELAAAKAYQNKIKQIT